MAINDIINDSWQGHSHGEVEQALKDKIQELTERLDNLSPGDTIGYNQLSSEVKQLLTKAQNALQTTDIAAWAKAANKPSYNANEIVGVEGYANLLAKLQAMDTAMSNKANDDDVVKSISVNGGTAQTPNNGNVNIDAYTKAQTDALLAGKQSTLTFDNAPTAGSTNPVKSGGIKTAIDQVTPTIDSNGKWVIGGVTTDKDAQGPRGNTVLVNEGSTAIQALIVNNVVDGGETDILSAEMGKVIRQNIMRIFNALGPYAFPEGKPILSWGSTVINHSINVNGVTGGLTISNVEVDGVSAASLPAQIVDGKSLSLKLNLPTGMYVFDGVAITMDGVAITNNTGVWDESTGTIYIASVTGDITITATAEDVISTLGYVKPNNIVFMLDGLQQGGNPSVWTDLVNGVVFTPNGATKAANGWQFDGVDDYMAGDGTMGTFESSTHTIEVVLNSGKTNETYVVFADAGGNLVFAYIYNYQNNDYYVTKGLTGWNGGAIHRSGQRDNGNGNRVVSYNAGLQGSASSGYINGVGGEAVNVTYSADSSNPRIGCRMKNGVNNGFFKGTVHAIRVYDTILTMAEMLANQKVDNQRFNLGLTIS